METTVILYLISLVITIFGIFITFWWGENYKRLYDIQLKIDENQKQMIENLEKMKDNHQEIIELHEEMLATFASRTLILSDFICDKLPEETLKEFYKTECDEEMLKMWNNESYKFVEWMTDRIQKRVSEKNQDNYKEDKNNEQ